jgi:uncharacterized protein YndB with AHSA1/START domain
MTTATETLTVEQFIARPPERVWKALTTPDDLAVWWVRGNIRPEPGHEFILPMDTWGDQQCKVIEARAPELLVYSFADWILTWRLTAQDGGTLLVLEQSGFNLERNDHRFAVEAMGNGWCSTILPRLASLVEGCD